MKLRRRNFLWLIAGTVFVLPVSDVHAEAEKSLCQSIDVNSAGLHEFTRSKIKALATSHGLSGVVDYVLLVQPEPESPASSRDIRQIIVMADVRTMLQPQCAKHVKAQEVLINCGQSLTGEGLKVVVNFDGVDPSEYVSRMPAIVDYVNREAICHRAKE
jgi:hypothetical protein